MSKRGIQNLGELIKNMEPVLNDGEYVFVSTSNSSSIPIDLCLGFFREKEGITLILPKSEAEKLHLPFEFTAAWITLNVHSALEAVGLTAAFSNELAKHNISCNVIAGYYHDHIFVDKRDGKKAVTVLQAMRTENR